MTRWRATTRDLALVALMVVASVSACMPGRSTGENSSVPAVSVSNPVPGEQVLPNRQILVTSQSSDPDGIQRVELWADGAMVRADINPSVGSPYVVAQGWQSDRAGSHVLVVKAYDARGDMGQSEPVTVTVGAVPEPTPVVQAPATAPATERPQPSPTATWQPEPTGTAVEPTSTPVSPTPPLPAATATPWPVCSPPACETGQVFHCPGTCPGGCGTECATPTPTTVRPTLGPTDFAVHELFRAIWDRVEVSQTVGYPTALANDNRQYARQYFERGYMYWWDRPEAPGLIWVVQMPDPGAMSGFGWIGPFEDNWDGGSPISCEAARESTYGPGSGFGRLWCDHPEIAQTIGAAREPERGTGESADYGVVQMFQGGTMLYSPLDREVWVLASGGAWQRFFR